MLPIQQPSVFSNEQRAFDSDSKSLEFLSPLLSSPSNRNGKPLWRFDGSQRKGKERKGKERKGKSAFVGWWLKRTAVRDRERESGWRGIGKWRRERRNKARPLVGSDGRFVRAAGVRLNENKPTSHITHWGLGFGGLLHSIRRRAKRTNKRIQIEIINGFVSRL